MKKRLLKLSLILVLCVGLIAVEGYKLAPKRFKTRLEVVASPLIGSSLNELSIAVISDLQGDEKALNKSIQAIQKAQAEVVIISGNTFGTLEDEETIARFQQKLIDLKPKYGKIALLTNEADRQQMDSYGFHTVTKNTLKIHTDTEEYFILQTNNTPDALSMENESIFSLLITNQYTPVDQQGYDVLIHPLNPESYIKVPGVYNDFKKKEHQDQKLILTHMGASTLEDVRLFSNPEILILTLKSQ